jgi:acyl carrier protein
MPPPSPPARASSPTSEGAEAAEPSVDQVLEEMSRIATRELELAGPVKPEARMADLGLDSLGLTVLAVGLENRFRVRLKEQDAEGIETASDLAALVVRRVREQRGVLAEPT